MDKLCAVDYETYWDKDFSLTTMSVYSYTHDPRFNAYLVAITNGDDIRYVGPPSAFDWSRLHGYTLCAHNAGFEAVVTRRLVETGVIKDASVAELPWLDSADLAAYFNVKRDLKSAVKYLLGREISKAVRAGTKGRSAAELAVDPEVLKYAGDDADNCLELINAYLPQWPEEEREISRLNREAAMYGLRVNQTELAKAIAELEPKVDALLADGEKPLSPNSFKRECERAGIPFPTGAGECNDYGGTRPCLAKGDPVFLQWLATYGPKFSWASAIGEYRSLNTFLKRIKVLRDGYDVKADRFPYAKKYCGAFTLRFSGGGDSGGKFNVENIPSEAMFGVALRPMFMAAPGHVLVVADYSQVEARALLWRAGDKEALKPCFEGRSVYQAYAEKTGICLPGVDLKTTDKHVYKRTKVTVLGGGYQSGGPKFKAFAAGYGLDLTEEEAAETIADYRRMNPLIVRYWREHHDALAFSARRRDETHQVELASGRILTYFNPLIRGREIEVTQIRGEPRVRAYGGLLTENEMQSTCRDILCHAWRAVSKAGIRIVLTVHDELVAEVPIRKADWAAETMRDLMCHGIPWADGLPLGVDIVIAERYEK